MKTTLTLKENLGGRIDNLFFRPSTQILVPLFEAISNSINAIKECTHNNGIITVELIRSMDAQKELGVIPKSIDSIVDIIVHDNGIGFDQIHFDQFSELDKRTSSHAGTRGIGRLFWLKVFDRVEIESAYSLDGIMQLRTIEFTTSGLTYEDSFTNSSKATGTTVKLIGAKRQYADFLRLKVPTVSQEVLKHFLPLFILDCCPHITISDSFESAVIHKGIMPSYESETITIRGHEFSIHHVKAESHDPPGHFINFCATTRVVERVNIGQLIQSFPRKKMQDENESFYYSGYVTSDYLTDRVRTERDAFSIDLDNVQGDAYELAWSEIYPPIAECAMRYLNDELEQLAKSREQTVREVFNEEMPELKYIQSSYSDQLDKIRLDADREDVIRSVNEIHFKNQVSEKANFKKIIQNIETDKIDTFEDFESSHLGDLRRISELNTSSLASYVIYRRHILEIFSKLISKLGDGSFEAEKAVHSLIFPRRCDSDEKNSYNDHNLWILDDRWALHEYIASDLPFNEHKAFQCDSDDKPDLVFYNLGFVRDASEEIHHSITIVEFKKPGRKNYKEDPVDQSFRYIDRIRSGNFRDVNGLLIHVDKEDVFFHIYIICDPNNPTIEHALKKYQLNRTFDGVGYRNPFHSGFNADIELIPFKKLLKDASTRNEIFFKRLGLLR